MSSLVDSPSVQFDLKTITEELLAEDTYVRRGKSSRAVVHRSDLRIVVIALKAGSTISEHQANATASIQTLVGRISLQLPEEKVFVSEGGLLVLETELSHDVYAEEDSVFILTLGWAASR